MQGQGMNRSGKLVGQQPVYLLVTLDRTFPAEGLTDKYQLEVRVRGRAGMHVTFIDQRQMPGLKVLSELVFYVTVCGLHTCNFMLN